MKLDTSDQKKKYNPANEQEILKLLREKSVQPFFEFFVPSLVPLQSQTETTTHFLVTEPVATVLEVGNSKITKKLLDGGLLGGVVTTLKLAHTNGIVHLDINPSNLYLISCEDPYIMTNDWGSSQREQALDIERIVYTEPYHNGLDVDNNDPFKACCRRDLISLVRSARLLLQSSSSTTDWEALLKEPQWANLLGLANACDYDALKLGLENFKLV